MKYIGPWSNVAGMFYPVTLAWLMTSLIEVSPLTNSRAEPLACNCSIRRAAVVIADQLLERSRGVTGLTAGHLATKSNQGVPSTRKASRQNPVVSRPSR